MSNDTPPEGFLDTSSDQNWRPCIICSGEILQVRKALFTCQGCGQEYISTEEDMRPEGYAIIKKARVR